MRWLLLALALLSAPAWSEARDPTSHFFQPKLGDFQGELDAAKDEGKQGVLIMFEMEDCPFCHRMKSTILNQSEVQDYFRKHFLIYTVDIKGDAPMTDFQGKQTTEKAFALEQRARATPVFIFYDLKGNVMTRFTGATQSATEFMLLGRYVVDGIYKGLPFSAFKRQQAAAQ